MRGSLIISNVGLSGIIEDNVDTIGDILSFVKATKLPK